MNFPPLTTQPGVPWYDLWPLQPPKKNGPGEKNFSLVDAISKQYPTDSEKHILFLSVAQKLSLPANSSKIIDVILPEVGRSYILQAIIVTDYAELEISFSTPDRRLIVEKGNPSAFVGGIPGKSWIEYKYLVPPQSPLTFEFTNPSPDSMIVDCVTVGQSVKGEV